MRDFISYWLDPISIVLSLVLAVPILWTWWDTVFGKNRRERRWFKEMRDRPANRPGILIVDLLVGRDVRPAVERFRLQTQELRDIPDDRILSVRRDVKFGPDMVLELQRELREAAATFLLQGVDTVHYFHAGPASVAAMVGAEFANSGRVLVYQHAENGSYEKLGPLRML